MVQKNFHMKPLIITTETSVLNPWFAKELPLISRIVRQTKYLTKDDFSIIHTPFSEKKPKVTMGIDGKVYIDQSWFYENFTRPNKDMFNTIIYLISTKERAELGLEQSYNGIYWLDKNDYIECYVIADEGKAPGRTRTRTAIDPATNKQVNISEFQRVTLHELGHAVSHFAGKQDNTHTLDYEARDVTRVFKEVDFQVWSLSAYLVALLTELKTVMTTKPKLPTVTLPVVKKSRLEEWAKAIEKFEDYVPAGGKFRGGVVTPTGSVSWRNRNPGNLRWSPFEVDNINNFSVFASYEMGWKALLHQLTIAVDGRSSVYKPEMTLLQFFKVYAPSEDNNFPEVYAKFVAKELGVDVNTVIKTLK